MKLIMIEGKDYFGSCLPESSEIIHLSWKDLAKCRLYIDEKKTVLSTDYFEIAFNQNTLMCVFSRKKFFECYLKEKSQYYQNSAWSAVIHYLGLHYPCINPLNPRNYSFSDAFYWTMWERARCCGLDTPKWKYAKKTAQYEWMPTTLISKEEALGQFVTSKINHTVQFEIIKDQIFWDDTNKDFILDKATYQRCLLLMNDYQWHMCCFTMGLCDGQWVFISIEPTLYNKSFLDQKAQVLVNWLKSDNLLYIDSRLRPKLV